MLVVVGLTVPQIVLYWPCVTGEKILLPLDILQQRGVYLPKPADGVWKTAEDIFVSDLVFVVEVNRRYAVEEVRAGRLPLWSPYNYAGSPFLAANHTAVLSPYRILDYLWPGPTVLVWSQVLQSVIAGIGAYLFFRRAMSAGFWPAALGCWLFPHLGFLVQWTGFTISTVASLLPWVLLATDAAVRRPRGLGGIGLGVAVAVLLVSGHSANAGHVLLASAMYMLWCVLDTHGRAGVMTWRAIGSAGAVVAGWVAGFLLAAPQLLPTLEYMQSSYRLAMRAQGWVDTPPQGPAALLQLIMPHVYGLGTTSAPYVMPSNRLESVACGYVGMVTLLVIAPLAWRLTRLRGMLWFWIALGVVGLIQPLGLLGTEHLFDLPLLHQLRNNRFVVVTGWSILAAAVMGLEVVRTQRVVWRQWAWALVGLAVLVAAYNVVRVRVPDPALATAVRQAVDAQPTDAPARLEKAADWFARMHWYYAGAALLCASLWLLIRTERVPQSGLVGLLGAVALLEVMANAWRVAAQRDAQLYYPRIEILAQVAARNDGRAVGMWCCPPSLNLVHRLREIRGYDAADPMRIVELLNLFPSPRSLRSPEYAVTQYFVPDPESPLLDMLNVKYLIARRRAPDDRNLPMLLKDDDYAVIENVGAMPRAWVPATATVVNDKAKRLELLKSRTFDPQQTAYVEAVEPLELRDCAGRATLVGESGNALTIDVEMETEGVVVVSEAWDAGWRAWVDGKETAVMPANHALRGVRVGKDAKRIEMRYAPRSFAIGVWVAGVAAVALLAWGVAAAATSTKGPAR